MKKHILYECESCGKKSRNRKEIEKCEAGHLGLTIEEKNKYDNLKEKARDCSRTISITNNNKTRAKLDIAIENLMDFEDFYNIKKEKI